MSNVEEVKRHICLDETAQIVDGKWVCGCPGGPYPSPYRSQQPAQPESGEAVRFKVPALYVPYPFAEVADKDGLAMVVLADALAAAQQRIAALHAALRAYGWHKPECDYMQEELPCTCGFMDAGKEPS